MANADIYDRFMTELATFMAQARIASSVTLRGCSLADIRSAQAYNSRPWPAALIAALTTFGGHSRSLFDGDDFGLSGIRTAAEVAREIATGPWHLGPAMLPILQHDGYVFHFVALDQGDDPPVHYYMETEPGPAQAFPSITAWLRELALFRLESKPWNDEICREIVAARETGRDWLDRKRELDRYDAEIQQLRAALQQRIALEDRQRGAITGPLEFQSLWVTELQATDLYRTLRRQGKRIPWGWRTLSDL
jgi:hypothetical protein